MFYKIKTIKTHGLLVLIIVCFSQLCSAQISYVKIGVDGLTCSQCSRSVEMQLRKLDFVKDVSMNLENTSGVIYLNDTLGNLSFDKIALAVKDAGFSLRYMKIKIPNSIVDNCITLNRQQFFIDTFSNTGVYQIIAKGFLPTAELKKHNTNVVQNCKFNKPYYLIAVDS